MIAACQIVKDILREILHDVASRYKKEEQPLYAIQRCSTKDENGEDVLCCLLQSTSSTENCTCDVIDPLDVAPVIRNYEHLVSCIIRVAQRDKNEASPKFTETVVASIPIAHWYVEPWQETLLRHTDRNGRWVDGDEPLDIVKIDDANATLYGIQVYLEEPCFVAVVTRPKLLTLPMAAHDQITHAPSDERVKMFVSGSNNNKVISMQVVPVDVSTVESFQAAKVSDRAVCRISASSPLIQVSNNDQEPESLTFEVPYVTCGPARELRTPTSRCPSPSFRHHEPSRDSLIPFTNRKGQFLTPSKLSPSSRRRSSAAQFGKGLDYNKSALHLVHIADDGEVKIKLLENTDEKIPNYGAGSRQTCGENTSDDQDKLVKFTVFDRIARIVVLETKGSLQYSDVRDVTQLFVNYVIKHNVKLRMYQDPRNLYSILFTASVEQPFRQFANGPEVMFPTKAPPVEKEIQLDEGDVVAIVFRGNVEVPESKKLLYSFHGFRGIKRHFDIEVLNPMSQRSLQTYHGALQIFKLKPPRRGAVDRTLPPSVKTGWVLAAEFPLLLPKYIKATPVIVHKAPVSVRFQEPLTVDFVKTLCIDLLPDWIRFSKALGISHARVQAIKQQHRNVVSEKVVMDVIVNWMKTRTISQDKVTPMVNALKSCHREKLSAELAQRQASIKSSRKHIEKDRNLQKAFSLIGKNRGVIARWRQIFNYLGHIDACDVIDVAKEIDDQGIDEYSKCQRALCYWKDHSPAPSVWTLVDALRASHCNIVAETIVAMETRSSTQ